MTDKKSLSERDICTKFITPSITGAGWVLHAQIREEVSFTIGSNYFALQVDARGERKRTDYILTTSTLSPLLSAKPGRTLTMSMDFRKRR
jgi:type I restriction enzyme R subunit